MLRVWVLLLYIFPIALWPSSLALAGGDALKVGAPKR